MQTKILVFGGGGMVASHLIDLLLEKEHEVWATVRWNEDLSNISHCKDKINLIECDLIDYTSVLGAIEKSKPDAISLLGAESYVNSSFVKPQATLLANGLGTLNVLEAVKYLKEKENYDPIIHICSSSEVYGLVTKDLVPIKEDCRFNPSNIYAVTKTTADMFALMYYTNYELKTIRTRMFTHFSYRRKMLSAEVNFANQIAMIERGNQEPILKHGNLDSVRTWADARDAVKAYYLILTQPKKFGEVYNIGGNATKTIGEMLNYMLSLSPMKDKIKLEQDPKLMRSYDVTLQIPDCTKFKTDYPEWKPEITFEQSIKELLEAKRNELER